MQRPGRSNMISAVLMALVLAVFSLGSLPLTANAALQAVGPNDPSNGYPVWYQDGDGLTLELCLPKNDAQLNAGVCLILPPALDPIAGMNLPIVFPSNYPDEAFWWNATGVMNLSATDNSVLVLALEAAFANGPVVPGDQVTFGRLRVVVDAPVAGDYTVTTPYGTFEFPNVAVGKRAIVFVSDIGIGAAGDFTGALNSNIGPFLQASATEGGAALPPVTIPLDASGDQFLSDAGLPVFVTGSPVGTNYFRICTTGGVFPINNQPCVTNNQFALMGRVFNGTPFVTKGANYTRNASGAGVINVFGTTATNSPTAVYEASGTGLTTKTMIRAAANGDLFASIAFTSGTTLPASVTVTATDPPKNPTAALSALTDLVTISKAAYDKSRHSLTIQAASSDLHVPPTLTATGFGTLVNGALVVSPVFVPPTSIEVTSSSGGTDTAAVTVFATVKPGVYADGGFWYLDTDGSGLWEGAPTDSFYEFGGGLIGAVPVAGDWSGIGITQIGIYADGNWYLDVNGNGAWDGTPVDSILTFGTGLAGAVPVVGDWNGSGTAKIGIYADGTWYLDTNGNGVWDGTPVDSLYSFGGGLVGAVPVTGDWDGSGTAKIGIYADGTWYLDTNGNGALDASPVDQTASFGAGLTGAIPVTGDVSGIGIASIGVYLDGTWYIDSNGNGAWDGTPSDTLYTFGNGLAGARPVVGQW